MAYQVLARKYRPKTFDEIVGQPHVSTALKNAVLRDRVSHAYLFSGPRGVGKTSTARILAKALNCPEPSGGDPCNTCEACGAIDRGLFMDVFEIDAASNRGIDEVRDLREKVRYPPQHGRYKVYIVDEVHMLTDHAFNAFLKTLEEPPPQVVFIFATTEAHRIPRTILSRCQRYDFRRIHVKEIVARMEAVLLEEGYGGGDLPEEVRRVLYAIARRVDGSLRDALSLLDQVLSFGDGAIAADALEGILGRVGEELYLELSRILRDRDAAGVFRFVQSLLDRGVDLDEFYYGFVDHIRSLILFRTGGEAGAGLELPPHLVEACREAAEAYTMEDLLRMARIVEREEYTLRTSHQRRFVLETLLLRLVMLDRTVSLNELLDRAGGRPVMDAGEKRARSVAAPRVASPPRTEPSRGTTGHAPSGPGAPAKTRGDAPAHPESPPRLPREKADGGGTVVAPVPDRVVPDAAPVAPVPDRVVPVPDRVVPDAAPVAPVPDRVVPDAAPVAPVPDPPVPVDGGMFDTVRDTWDEVTTRVKARKISLGNFLAAARPVGLEGGALVLGVGDGMDGFLADQLQRASNLQLVFDVVSEVVGRRVSWNVEVRRLEGETPPPEVDHASAELIQKVRKMFDAELIREEEERTIR